MNREQLDEIRARAQAATEGPWTVHADEVENSTVATAAQWFEEYGRRYHGVRPVAVLAEGNLNEGDAEFIAAARQDVPALLDEIERLNEADGLARDALRRSGYHFSSDSGKPLAELIEKLNTDARDAVRACGEESARLRAQLAQAQQFIQLYGPGGVSS